MAFFGLTMLGPQNSFQELLKKHSVLRIFEMSEFAAAFDSARSETVDQSQVLEILEVVYRGKLPAADAALCGEFFRGQEHFRKEEFLSIVECVSMLFFVSNATNAGAPGRTRRPGSAKKTAASPRAANSPRAPPTAPSPRGTRASTATQLKSTSTP